MTLAFSSSDSALRGLAAILLVVVIAAMAGMFIHIRRSQKHASSAPVSSSAGNLYWSGMADYHRVVSELRRDARFDRPYAVQTGENFFSQMFPCFVNIGNATTGHIELTVTSRGLRIGTAGAEARQTATNIVHRLKLNPDVLSNEWRPRH